MTPEALLDRLVPMMLARLPAEQHTAFRAWAKANRDEVVEAIREALGGLLEKLRSRASGASDGGIPNAERWSAGKRTGANLTAMNIAARLLAEERRPTSNERYALALYSGWGGLSIEGVADKFPAGFPVPEKRGLIHEYYTPGGIAGAVGEAILPLLPGLPRHEDRVAVLEPSAGIGRFIRGLGTRKELDWHAVEWSALSATMLAALYPDIDVFHGPFERWVREQGKDWRGRFGLVLSNPPYGARGSAITEDSDRSFRERKAYAYFLRRGLDMLAPNGLAVFLVPYGFLSGQTDELRALRESILRVAHLSAAYRLPSGIFPGANLVTDLLFFRGRGGTLAEVDETDQGILAGQYFRAFPEHVLGREVGAGGSDDDQSATATRSSASSAACLRWSSAPCAAPAPCSSPPRRAPSPSSSAPRASSARPSPWPSAWRRGSPPTCATWPTTPPSSLPSSGASWWTRSRPGPPRTATRTSTASC